MSRYGGRHYGTPHNRRWLPLVIVAASASVVTGCGFGTDRATAGGPTESGGEGRVQLRIAVWDELQEPTQREFAEAFEAAHPDVTVELDVLAFREYVKALQTAEAGGSGYDLVWMNAPNLPMFVSNGIILSLNDYVERDGFDTTVFPQGLVDMYTVDGEYYAVSKDFDTIGLYFDKHAFTEAGIAAPSNDWTWDDLADAAASLTTDQRKGFAVPPYEQEVLFPFIFLADGRPLDATGSATDFASREACDALQFLESFHADETTLDLATLATTSYVESLIAGDVAMLTTGSWDAKRLEEQMGERLGVVELPAGAREANLVHGLGWAIMSSSQHPDVAWEYIKSVSTREAHARQADAAVVISSYEGTAQAWVDSFDDLDASVFVEAAAIADPFPVAAADGGWTFASSEAFADAVGAGHRGDALCARVDQAATDYIADHPVTMAEGGE